MVGEMKPHTGKKVKEFTKKYLKKGRGCGRLNERAEEACEQPA